MPDQKDYGTPDSEVALVPDSLIAYRHFSMYDGQLWPMAGVGMYNGYNPYRLTGMPQRSQWALSGCGCPLCYTRVMEDPRQEAGGYPHRRGPERRDRYFTAECMYWEYNFGGWRAGHTPDHDAPRKTCKCGFYAHYAPYEDFYSTLKWSWGLRSELSNPFIGASNDTALIKAVVRLSGRVIMGTKGVRAERLQIVALVPDWDKLVVVSSETQPRFAWRGGADYSNRKVWSVYAAPKTRADAETRESVMSALESVADQYKAEVYLDEVAMYRNYPRPDLSHLLGDEAR